MPIVWLLWDASALVKRYAPEIGSDSVEALFQSVPTYRQVSSAVTYAEIYSVLIRKLNRGAINQAAFDTAKSSLRTDLIIDPGFVLLSVDDAAFYRGIPVMEQHNLNSTDSALLGMYSSFARSLNGDADQRFILVAADERLIRVSLALGLDAINPESISPIDVPTLLTNR